MPTYPDQHKIATARAKARSRLNKTNPNRTLIFSLYGFMSYSQIGNKLGISRQRVRQIAKEMRLTNGK